MSTPAADAVQPRQDLSSPTDSAAPANGRRRLPRRRKVFISYRHGETTGQARAIRDHLAARLGDDRIFMDVESIDPGVDFLARIDSVIDSCGVLLAVIGRDWFGAPPHEDRLSRADDYVRHEVETALRAGVPVVPILVERAGMPRSEDLPPTLQPLVRSNALALENSRWDYDIKQLRRAVGHRIGRFGRRQILYAVLLVGALGAAGGVGIPALVSALRTRPAPATPTGGPYSAAAAVDAVTAPQLLLSDLVHGSLSGAGFPNGVSVSGSTVVSLTNDSISGLAGLLGELDTSIAASQTSYDWVDYYVFDNPTDAASFYETLAPASTIEVTGSFADPQVTDPSTCFHAHQRSGAILAYSECAVLSGLAVTWVGTEYEGTSPDDPLTYSFVAAGLTHLAGVAAQTSDTGWASVSPTSLLAELGGSQGELSPVELPSGLSSSQTVMTTTNLSSTAGLIDNEFVDDQLGNGIFGDNIQCYVFDSDSDANAWLASPLAPTGFKADFSGVLFPESSFPSGQIECSTYEATNGSSTTLSACYAVYNDIVVRGDVFGSDQFDADIAVELARSAEIHLDGLVSGA